MALFPRIQSPCPYKDRLGEIMEGDFCRMCERQVHDITAMSDQERVALVAGCRDEICVSYRLPARTALAAAAMSAAFGMPVAAAAQDVPAQDASAQATGEDPMDYDPIIVGGLKMPKHVTWVDTKKPANLAELPVVYEAGPAGAAPAEVAAEPEEDFIVIVAGGLKNASTAQTRHHRKPKDLAELPVIEEDAAVPAKPVNSAS